MQTNTGAGADPTYTAVLVNLDVSPVALSLTLPNLTTNVNTSAMHLRSTQRIVASIWTVANVTLPVTETLQPNTTTYTDPNSVVQLPPQSLCRFEYF